MRADPLPSEIRVLTLFGAEYYIPWEELPRGGSFFIPTTATPKQVYIALIPAEKYLDMELEVRSRCEFGRYGARVWRLR
jgi:hypothetical protein